MFKRIKYYKTHYTGKKLADLTLDQKYLMLTIFHALSASMSVSASALELDNHLYCNHAFWAILHPQMCRAVTKEINPYKLSKHEFVMGWIHAQNPKTTHMWMVPDAHGHDYHVYLKVNVKDMQNHAQMSLSALDRIVLGDGVLCQLPTMEDVDLVASQITI